VGRFESGTFKSWTFSDGTFLEWDVSRAGPFVCAPLLQHLAPPYLFVMGALEMTSQIVMLGGVKGNHYYLFDVIARENNHCLVKF
jgi:hypothetical protein